MYELGCVRPSSRGRLFNWCAFTDARRAYLMMEAASVSRSTPLSVASGMMSSPCLSIASWRCSILSSNSAFSMRYSGIGIRSIEWSEQNFLMRWSAEKRRFLRVSIIFYFI